MQNRKCGGGSKFFLCPVEQTLDVIGGKWKTVIIYHIMVTKKLYNELKRILPGITQKVLTNKLREMEADGIVYRNVSEAKSLKTEYSLTPLGHTLVPLVTTMDNWGESYADAMGTGKDSETGLI